MARTKRSEDFWVSVMTAPFLLYVFYLIVKALCSLDKNFCFIGYTIWFIALIGYIYYVFEGVRRRYG
jgi:hypothetical protein